MPAPKRTEATAPAKAETSANTGRKPWVKKSPVQVVLDQAEKLKAEIAAAEEEIKTKRKQLEKFEQARKLFETP